MAPQFLQYTYNQKENTTQNTTKETITWDHIKQ